MRDTVSPTSQLYLDNNATTMIDPDLARAMYELAISGLANPSSQHAAGRRALHLLEEAKRSIACSLGAKRDSMDAAQVILTSGGTEANNLALHAFTHQRPGLVIVGAMEHSSLSEAAELSTLCLNPIRILPALKNGQYDLSLLKQWLDDIYGGRDKHQQVALVSLMMANNETGVINDLTTASQACRQYDVPLHSDLVQALGKIDIDIQQLGLTAATIAVHKVHGPVGIGGLIVNGSLAARPMLIGGGQQLGWRAGTENVVLAFGLAQSLSVADACRRRGDYRRVAQLRDRFEEYLQSNLPSIVINGDLDSRLPHTSNVSFLGTNRQSLHMSLDLAGLACSTGSACASGSSLPSKTLLAMRLDDQRVASAVRFSLSRMTTEEQSQQAAETVVRTVNRSRSLKSH